MISIGQVLYTDRTLTKFSYLAKSKCTDFNELRENPLIEILKKKEKTIQATWEMLE